MEVLAHRIDRLLLARWLHRRMVERVDRRVCGFARQRDFVVAVEG